MNKQGDKSERLTGRGSLKRRWERKAGTGGMKERNADHGCTVDCGQSMP